MSASDGRCPVCGKRYVIARTYDRHIEQTSHHLFVGDGPLCHGYRPDGLKGWRPCDLTPGHLFHRVRKRVTA